MNRDKLVHWFVVNYPSYFDLMNDTTHQVDSNKPNPFHAEGSVWTHTMMVMTWIEWQYSHLTVEDYVSLITTGMLHDLGKCFTQEFSAANEHKPDRYSFKGHEGVSVMYSIEILKQLKVEFPETYTDDIVETIIKLIGTHGVAVEGEDYRHLREIFRIADKKGAIRCVDEDIFSQYEKRKFAKNHNPKEGKELVVMTGLPCVGKSTFIKNYLKEYSVLSRDNMLFEYYTMKNGQNELDYNTIYKWIHETDEKREDFDKYFDKRVGEMAKSDDLVVIDMTMMSLSSRRKMLNKFPSHKKSCVVMLTDNATLQQRNKRRIESEGKNIPNEVFFNMSRSFTYPVKEEGFSDILLVVN